MTIIVKSVSPKYGGNGGINHNDLLDIISAYGDSTNIKSINIKRIEFQSANAVNSLQFTYNIMTTEGESQEFQGNKFGGDGGTRQDLILTVNEQLMGISGRYGIFFNHTV